MENNAKNNKTNLTQSERDYHYSHYPQTRFQGSKYRLLDWFDNYFSELQYETVLDAFSGSGVVSYYFKTQKKSVVSNDILKSSFITSKAFIENSEFRISEKDIKGILELPDYSDHEHFIEKNYQDYYFTNDENIWLDGFISNVRKLDNIYLQACFYWVLFQACLVKRPYNLFHRKNLYMRLEDVVRSFGNKTTWDRPFPVYITKFARELNQAIFDNGRSNSATNLDISIIDPKNYDLVYIDPPYMKINKNTSGNDYQNYYHFLEGILDYDNWKEHINPKLKHSPYIKNKSNWIKSDKIVAEFEQLIKKFQDSTLVISYNTEGFPSPNQLKMILESYREDVQIHTRDIKYALKKKKRKNTEVLIIA